MSDKSTVIIIPTVNRELYLIESLNYSLLNMLNDYTRLIICHNKKSEEPEYTLVKNLLTRHPAGKFVEYHVFEKQLSMFENWDRCLKMSMRYDYVAFFHDDDLYESKIIEKEKQFLLNNNSCGMVFSNIRYIDSKGRSIASLKKIKKLSGNRILAGKEFIKGVCLDTGYAKNFLCQTLMYRVSILKKLNFKIFSNCGVPCGILNGVDYYGFMKLARIADIGYLNSTQAAIRIHSKQGSSCSNGAYFNILEHYVVLRKFIMDYNPKLGSGIFFYKKILKALYARWLQRSFKPRNVDCSYAKFNNVLKADFLSWFDKLMIRVSLRVFKIYDRRSQSSSYLNNQRS